MATNYYQDPLGVPDYSAEGMPSLLSLSNLESLGRGSVAGLLDLPYFFEGMLMGDQDPRMPQRGRVVPSSEQVLATTPRMTQPTPQAGLLETAGAFMSPAPVAAVKPVAQAFGRGGKAVARMAGSEINAAMMGERGGLLGAMTPQPMRLDVYHGTPHGPFRQFDPTKIGTGEGAQVYGYGHYLGEARGTGETYRDTLAYKAFDLDPEAKKLGLNLSVGTRGEFIRQTRADKPPEVLAKQLQNANIAARDLPQDKLAELFKAYKEKGGGYLYKVDLPDEQITKMLDWDKPMTEQEMISIYDRMQQSPLTGFAKTFQDNFYERMNRGQPTTDGQDLFMELSKELGGQKQVSDYLNSIGVPGIRYLDQMSRQPGVASLTQSQIDARINSLKSDIASGLGDQKRMKEILSSLEAERASHPKLTSNFVVFPGNENLLTIKEINDQPASLLFPTP